MSFAVFFSSNPDVTITPGSWTVRPCTRAAGLFGAEIQVGIQSSGGAGLSRSDLEKVVHSKFHLTHREAGGLADCGSKESENGVRRSSQKRTKFSEKCQMVAGCLSFHEYCIL